MDSAAAIEALRELRALCDSRRALAVDGSITDVDTIWPSEVLEIINSAGLDDVTGVDRG